MEEEECWRIETYDAIVLGSGEGGKYLAWHLASSGAKVAVIERKYLGGSCPNIACLPSKNVIHSAKIASMLDATHGLGLTGSCSFPMSLVRPEVIIRQAKPKFAP